ncbi:copper amine oxidase N-terminal domain-containing protein [Cohnella hongkongensis]|uniref:Copper amine oxidase N-terminal domain-containing protein n=1 Tax=Cohnella hongkongensis TaxID=178337 RepID=A0ABV9F8B7_9BACL
MTKKPAAVLLASSMLLSVFAGQISAQKQTVTQVQGKYVQGRTLIPLRAVSESLGAAVEWSQSTFTATITKEDTEIILPIHSDSVTINGESILLDARARLEGGVTYVPLRFVAQTLGGAVSWEASTGTATASLGDRKVVIATQYGKKFPAIAASRVNALVKAANESADLSAYKQIRTHFRPYFTNSYINKLIQRNGVSTKHEFVSKPDTFFYQGEGHGYIRQFESPRDAGGMNVERMIMVRYIDGAWMAEDIHYILVSP